MKTLPLLFATVCYAGLLPTHAQVADSYVVGHRVHAPLQVVEIGAQLYTYTIPPQGWNRVDTRPGTTIRLQLADQIEDPSNIEWLRNYQPLATTGDQRYLDLPNVSADDNATYSARFRANSQTGYSSSIELRVGSDQPAALKNISTLAHLSAGTPAISAGFVLGTGNAGESPNHYVLIRAAGPSLSEFGVATPVPDPSLSVFNHVTGDEIALAFIQIAYPDGSTPESLYYNWVRAVSTAIGAFPLDLNRPGHAGAERAMLLELPPGNYSVTARSHSGATGEMLLEVYTVPASVALALQIDPPALTTP